jgi:hypothetical protein
MKSLAIILVLSLISCSKIEKKYIIDKKVELLTDSIVPIKNGDYTVNYLEISGQTDDTIIIKPCKGCFENFLTGKINEKYSMDYYGTQNVAFIYKAYKAKQVNLKINFVIN